jgi:predicted amidohydrolase YtcJ
VLGGDPFSVPAAELSRVGVRRTFVGGREVWSADLARRAPQ